ESSADFSAEEAEEVARIVGIGAVKYADLSVAHDTSYTFDLDRMLAPFGNTAPYLQYAGARIRSIGRKAEAEGVSAAELATARSEEHTSELQSRFDLVCRLLLEKKKTPAQELQHT